MKTTATKLENKDTEHEYPLLVTDRGLVAYALCSSEGSIVHVNDEGDYGEFDFIDESHGFFDSWQKYEGVITLENN